VPDWAQLVRTRLGDLGLGPEREAEIVAELADHLQDLYDSFRQEGFPDGQAVEQTLASVSDWVALSRNIRRAEGVMSHQECLWLPGLYGLLFYVWCLQLAPGLVFGGRRSGAIWLLQHGDLFRFLFVILPMFVVAAVTAYWSKRAGGGVRERLLAAAFPFFFHLALLPLWLAVYWLRGLPVLNPDMWVQILAGMSATSAAVLLGALPFLRDGQRAHSSGSPPSAKPV